MRVLVACECSGRVRDAFRALGHDAWSCDLKPSETSEGGYHLEGDVRWWLTPEQLAVWKWDLMIAHPECTFLTVSNNGPVANGCNLYTAAQARQWRQEAIDFFLEMINAPIPRIAVENPIGIMSTRFRRPDQIIQPWQFGDDASKRTCLWLKGLPLLIPTNILPGGGRKLAVPTRQRVDRTNSVLRQTARSCDQPHIQESLLLWQPSGDRSLDRTTADAHFPNGVRITGMPCQ